MKTKAMEEEERLMEALADVEEDTIPDDGTIEGPDKDEWHPYFYFYFSEFYFAKMEHVTV